MTQTFLTWRASGGRLDDVDRIIDFLTNAKDKIIADEDLELVISCVIEKEEIWLQIAKLVLMEVADPDGPYEAKPIETLVLGCVVIGLLDDGTQVRLKAGVRCKYDPI